MTDELLTNFQKQLDKLKQRKEAADKREAKIIEEENALEKYKENLNEMEKKLREDRIELEKEKEIMQAIEIADDDIVEINIQGTIFYTSRQTLTQVPGARLTYFFNGRHEKRLNRDKSGRVFFDIIPSQFSKLLNYLTARRLVRNKDEISPPSLEGEYAGYFQNLVRYFGLENELYGGPMSFSRILKSFSIVLNDEATTAWTATDGLGFVLGEGVYSDDFIEFTLCINQIDAKLPKMFIGVMINSSDPIEDNSFNGNSRAYGFSDKGGVWVAGKKMENQTTNNKDLQVFRTGMEIKLVLSCRSGKNYLCMMMDENEEVQMIDNLPEGQKWRLHVNLAGKGDGISLINIQDAIEE